MAPTIRNREADQRFGELVSAYRLPRGVWTDGYVEFEWTHGRLLLEEYRDAIAGKRVLEVGCNVGATTIILALMGADVTAIDIDQRFCELAELNARRYGVEHQVSVRRLPDTRNLPFESGAFDFISCNSVLECIPHEIRAAVQHELLRVLKPGGILAVLGTSSRLWPREVHSRKWLVNYLPRIVDPWIGKRLQRGVWPKSVKAAFPGTDDLQREDGGARYLRAKMRMGLSPRTITLIRAVATLLRPLGYSPGMLMPSMALILRKR